MNIETFLALNPVQLRAQSELAKIRAEIDKDGYARRSTCDAMNWDRLENQAMEYLYRNCPADLHMTRQVNWGVTDWTIAIK